MIRTRVPAGVTRLGIRRPRELWEIVADTFGVPRWFVRKGLPKSPDASRP